MRVVSALLLLVLGSVVALGAWGAAARQGAAELSLSDDPGALTGWRLAALADEGPRCRALLADAGVRFQALPGRPGQRCGPREPVRLAGGASTLGLRPADVAPSCPVAAALVLWEWHVVQPAARRHFGTRVATVEHYGSYSCRRIGSRPDAGWSEHATAKAIDVAAFRLADGRRVTVLGDWPGEDASARFLREVRDGACGLFATVLSPDYNRAHRDHLHLDQAARGATGWRACR